MCCFVNMLNSFVTHVTNLMLLVSTKRSLLKTGAVRAANDSGRGGPAADWFFNHNPMYFNQSGDFVGAGRPFTCSHK